MARAGLRGLRPRMSCPATADSLFPRYGDCGEDNAAATARDPDAAGWRDAIAAASSPGCCRWHRTATATPFTKVIFFFHDITTLYVYYILSPFYVSLKKL